MGRNCVIRRRLYLLVSITIWCFSLLSGTSAESLVKIDSRSFCINIASDLNVPISALLLGDDSVISGSGGGLWAQLNRHQPWQELIGSAPKRQWAVDCFRRKRFSRLFVPEQVWKVSSTGDIIVYERHCGCLLRLVIHDTGNYICEMWKDPPDGTVLGSAMIQEDLLLGGCFSSDRKLMVISKADSHSGYHGIVDFPLELEKRLDSVGINYAYCRPALNPTDRSIWIAVWGYNYMYITDMNGELMDSVEITAPDYITPAPPISRIKSKAIWNDWMSKWTPTTVFCYVPPGYFFLQYRTDWQKYDTDSIPLYSTQVWDVNRTPVVFDIDSDWQLAGVQSDGRVIFGRYARAADSLKVELIVTRIEQ
jgi:hypothetical protein